MSSCTIDNKLLNIRSRAHAYFVDDPSDDLGGMIPESVFTMLLSYRRADYRCIISLFCEMVNDHLSETLYAGTLLGLKTSCVKDDMGAKFVLSGFPRSLPTLLRHLLEEFASFVLGLQRLNYIERRVSTRRPAA